MSPISLLPCLALPATVAAESEPLPTTLALYGQSWLAQPDLLDATVRSLQTTGAPLALNAWLHTPTGPVPLVGESDALRADGPRETLFETFGPLAGPHGEASLVVFLGDAIHKEGVPQQLLLPRAPLDWTHPVLWLTLADDGGVEATPYLPGRQAVASLESFFSALERPEAPPTPWVGWAVAATLGCCSMGMLWLAGPRRRDAGTSSVVVEVLPHADSASLQEQPLLDVVCGLESAAGGEAFCAFSLGGDAGRSARLRHHWEQQGDEQLEGLQTPLRFELDDHARLHIVVEAPALTALVSAVGGPREVPSGAAHPVQNGDLLLLPEGVLSIAASL